MNKLREAWLTIAAADYETHMANIGQAQANGELTNRWLESLPFDGALLFAGAGPGQMLPFLTALPRPEIYFSDINPAFLELLAQRLAIPVTTHVDDIENSSLIGPFPHVVIVLVLEHVDWPKALANLPRWQTRRAFIVIQQNAEGVSSAVSPGRTVPGTMQQFRDTAHPHLIPLTELRESMESLGYALVHRDTATVIDGKQMHGCWFEAQ